MYRVTFNSLPTDMPVICLNFELQRQRKNRESDDFRQIPRQFLSCAARQIAQTLLRRLADIQNLF